MAETFPEVIKLSDPFYTERPYLNFEVLRSEGVRHLGELSGQIWTDHNLHDPGITILETLCYALIDLGYRSDLDIKDLLAKAPDPSQPAAPFAEDNNFFTPLEILSCNPTTVRDYRKLLLGVKGVRNVWLEPAPLAVTGQEKGIYLNPADKTLTCDSRSGAQLPLNGLYRILVEKFPEEKDEDVVGAVRKAYAQYRNLCEDERQIRILEPFAVGLCADVEIEPFATTAAVYEKIIAAVRDYITPSLRYYTLGELLAQGKPIEEIFAGRPFGMRSLGFVDNNELDKLARRESLYASDLYRLLLGIEGVRAIRQLYFTAKGQSEGSTGEIQVLSINEGHVATFSVEKTCIQMRSGNTTLRFDPAQPSQERPTSGRQMLARSDLDVAIPQGQFAPEFAAYRSIQEDFPKTYGLGHEGLGHADDLTRQVQVRQLQGYLLFYDQLLADYLAQMANFRDLFSLKQKHSGDSSKPRTYFSQSMEGVAGIDYLWRTNAARDLTPGSVLAVPVECNELDARLKELAANPRQELVLDINCEAEKGSLSHFAFEEPSLLDLGIEQAMRDLKQGDFEISTYKDKSGYFFCLRFTEEQRAALVGNLRYRTSGEAHAAGHTAGFLATRLEYYRKTSVRRENKIYHRYEVVANASADATFLQHLTENEDLYQRRREAFLDHLLARFAQQFTDYVLLRFGAELKNAQQRQIAIDDKARFLEHAAKATRNRGRAFNYQEPSWRTHNVSGYEQRIALLAGLPSWKRRHLCKFEVLCRLVIRDPDGKEWFSAHVECGSEQDLGRAKRQFLEELRSGLGYERLVGWECILNPVPVRRLFSAAATDENIQTRFIYRLQLRNVDGEVLQTSAKGHTTKKEAEADRAAFLEEIKTTGEPPRELKPTDKAGTFYTTEKEVIYSVETAASWRWSSSDVQGRPITSEAPLETEAEAKADFARAFIVPGPRFGWRMTEVDKELLVSTEPYANETAAVEGYLRAREALACSSNLVLVGEKPGKKLRIQLQWKGKIIGQTPATFPNRAMGNAALASLCRDLKRFQAPVAFEPPLYRWQIRRMEGAEKVYQSPNTFPSTEAAHAEFAAAMSHPLKEDLRAFAPMIFTIEPLATAEGFRFLYSANSDDQKSGPRWRSLEEFSSRKVAEEKYAEFVRSLSEQAVAGAKPANEPPQAELVEDNEANRKAAEKLKAYLRNEYSGRKVTVCNDSWIYRLLDRDRPLAKTAEPLPERFLRNFKPYIPPYGSEVLRIEIRSDLTWETPARRGPIRNKPTGSDSTGMRYHFTITLTDLDGKEQTVFISYLYYSSPEAARKAGEDCWLQLIEIATDVKNYGEKGKIALEEVFDQIEGLNAEAQPYLACLSNEFVKGADPQQAVERAAKLAKRYPVRIVYDEEKEKEDQKEQHPAKLPRKIKGYRFQAYDVDLKKVVWEGAEVFPTPQKAFDEYRIFAVILDNHASYRVVFEEGKYWLHLVEILAESCEFSNPKEAWKEVQRFAFVGTEEEAYLPRRSGKDCYDFEVVAPTYLVAWPTCTYTSAKARDEAIKKLLEYAKDKKNLPTYPHPSTNPNRFHIGEGYYFELEPEDRERGVVLTAKLIDRWLYLGVSRANYNETHTDLVDRFRKEQEGGVAIAKLGRAGGPFNFEDFLTLARRYPVFKKGDRYRFRLFYEENAGVLDENEDLKPYGCEPEKGKTKSKAPGEIFFCGKPYILESVKTFPSREAAGAASVEFLASLTDENNYDRPESESPLEPYSFTIVQSEKPLLATYPNCQPDMAGAVRAAGRARACLNDTGLHLLEHILLRPKTRDSKPEDACLLPTIPDTACELPWEDDMDRDDSCAGFVKCSDIYIPGQDPYSFWATVVLPGWSPRFNSEEKRERFKELLYREAPALVALNIFWLNLEQMNEFDRNFRAWLAWRELSDNQAQSDVLCRLVQTITRLHDDPPAPPNEPGSVTCACLTESERAPTGQLITPPQLFWGGIARPENEADPKPKWQFEPPASERTPAPRPEHSGPAEPTPPTPEQTVTAELTSASQPEPCRPDAVLAPQPAPTPTPDQPTTSAGPSTPEAQIRGAIGRRKIEHKNAINAAASESLRTTKGFQRALQFVENPPPRLDDFKQLVTQILETDMGPSGTEACQAFTTILQIATWHLLDYRVQEHHQRHQNEIPATERATLAAIFRRMKDREIDLSPPENGWFSESLQEVMESPTIQQYLELLAGA